MTTPDVSTPGEREPSVPPPSLDSEFTSFAGQLYVPKLSINQVIVWLALVVVLIGLDYGHVSDRNKGIQPSCTGP